MSVKSFFHVKLPSSYGPPHPSAITHAQSNTGVKFVSGRTSGLDHLVNQSLRHNFVLASTAADPFSPAYGIFHLHGPLKNWQYLFIIEGVLTILAGLVAWPWLPSGPGSAWFLSPKERRFAADRIRKDNELYTSHVYSEDGVEKDRLTRRDVIETARDWKLWYVLAFNICASVPGQAFSVFLPLVVQGLGYSSIEANLVRRLFSSSRISADPCPRCRFLHMYAAPLACTYSRSARITSQ